MSDFRKTREGRRHSWFGLKKHVKRALAMRVPHALLRALVKLRPSLRRGGRLPAPASLHEVPGRLDDARFVMLDPDRCEVAKELYWGGGRLPNPADAFALELFAGLARKADVMLDVGAYTGLFTLVSTLVNTSLRAYAFELVPDIFELLTANCARNGVSDRVSLHNLGVGEEGASMMVPAGTRDSALPSFYSSRMHFESGVTVPFRSLDSIGADISYDSRIAMKVDVEGTENDVFRNGRQFLLTFKPDILCEVLHGVADPAELQRMLEPYGYRFWLVKDAGLEPHADITPDPNFRDWAFSTHDL